MDLCTCGSHGLDSHQARITLLRLVDRKLATLDAIAAELKLTTKIVRYNAPI